MTNPPKKAKREDKPIPQVPFNEALKQVWASPPQHKTGKKKSTRKNKPAEAG